MNKIISAIIIALGIAMLAQVLFGFGFPLNRLSGKSNNVIAEPTSNTQGQNLRATQQTNTTEVTQNPSPTEPSNVTPAQAPNPNGTSQTPADSSTPVPALW